MNYLSDAEETLDYILFAQHGWADTNHSITRFAQALADDDGITVISPNLGFYRTWWRIAPLINQVEQIAAEHFELRDRVPKRIIGHSMGGLIWLEVLHRHPDWWSQVDSLSLVGSPVGGADLGRLFDPLQWGIGIARDLGINRRPIAERIAQQIPTQVIASDLDGGSDGTVPLQCSKFRYAQYVQLAGIHHDQLKHHPEVAKAIQQFWQAPRTVALADFENALIVEQLQAIPGMTDAHYRDFAKASVWATLPNGATLRTWQNVANIHHVFLADAQGVCQFAGFVGWLHTKALYQALERISKSLIN
ncbi:MAG: lysophospholipase [Leptolyngbya sp. SIO4C1]|nr:lysophospholipase [Leptolyngbya sp. SIO4C1]